MDTPCGHNRGENSGEKTSLAFSYFRILPNTFSDLKLSCVTMVLRDIS